MGRGEVALQHAQPDHQQHDRAERDVQAVEAGQHEEGRAVHAGAERQVELVVGVHVLLGLQADEQEAQDEGEREEHLQHAAVAGLERVVGDGDRHARGEQDRGVERRQAERRDGLEAAADVPGAVGGPARLESRPQEQVGEEPRALAAEPRHRQLPRVVERAEERGEEHHLGEDEPRHAHAERAVHARVVQAALALADHGAEPTEEHVGDARESDVGDPRTDVHPVQHGGGAGHRDEQRDGPDRRPLAAVRDVVLVAAVRGVCLGHGSSFPLVLLQTPAPWPAPGVRISVPRACSRAACTSSRRASCGPPAAAGRDRR